MAHLNIPAHLADRKDFSLGVGYQKYLGFLQAKKTLDTMVQEGRWTGKTPTTTDLIEIFISKSMWHEHYRTNFKNVAQYPLMVQWLEGGDNKPGDLEVWGIAKTSYTFKDLSAWLKNNGALSLAGDSGGSGKQEGDSGKKDKGKKKAKDKVPTTKKSSSTTKKHSK